MSYLPGQIRDLIHPCHCDTHENVPAVKRIIGECDSFGHEESYVCQQCLDEHIAEIDQADPVGGHCDWCKCYYHDLKPRRDFEEGNNGPVYYVCDPCFIKHHQQCFGSD